MCLRSKHAGVAMIRLSIPYELEISCVYYCWSSVLGDLDTPAGSKDTRLGMGLFVMFKLEAKTLHGWQWGTVMAQSTSSLSQGP